jgi:uncharacterized protein YciI
MFIIMLNYKKPLDIVEQYLAAHRAYLDEGYKKDFFVASGPKNPRTGGIIISQLKDREQLEKILQHDPFYTNNIIDYEIIEFTPVKCHQHFSGFIS